MVVVRVRINCNDLFSNRISDQICVHNFTFICDNLEFYCKVPLTIKPTYCWRPSLSYSAILNSFLLAGKKKVL